MPECWGQWNRDPWLARVVSMADPERKGRSAISPPKAMLGKQSCLPRNARLSSDKGAAMTDPIKTALHDGVLTLTLARPDKKNALSNAMYQKLTDELLRAEKEPSVRVVLIEAEGDMFCAGNDIADFAAVATGKQAPETLAAYPFLLALTHLSKPLVAAVQGSAVGIGTTMLLHCDAVFIAEDAKLTAPFADLALVPEAASSLLLPERVGYARAYAVFALGEAIDGKLAGEIGLATVVLPANEVQIQARVTAERLVEKPMGALKAIKKLMRDSAAIAAVIDKERDAFAARLKTPEAAEAFKAFAEKRKPDFKKLG
jgi:enoyl-CoA hydratase/carnithine racemase